METHGRGSSGVMTQSWRGYLDLGKKSYLSVFFLLFSVCTEIQPAGWLSQSSRKLIWLTFMLESKDVRERSVSGDIDVSFFRPSYQSIVRPLSQGLRPRFRVSCRWYLESSWKTWQEEKPKVLPSPNISALRLSIPQARRLPDVIRTV